MEKVDPSVELFSVVVGTDGFRSDNFCQVQIAVAFAISSVEHRHRQNEWDSAAIVAIKSMGQKNRLVARRARLRDPYARDVGPLDESSR